MPSDRGQILASWVSEIIRNTCLAQGWNSSDYEFAVNFLTARTPAGPAVAWSVLLTLDSGLIGKPALVTTVTLRGARPLMDDVCAGVVQGMGGLWQAKLSRLGTKTAKPAAAGKLVIAE